MSLENIFRSSSHPILISVVTLITTSIIFTYLFRIGTKNYRSFIRNSKLMFITTK